MDASGRPLQLTFAPVASKVPELTVSVCIGATVKGGIPLLKATLYGQLVMLKIVTLLA